MSDAVRAARTVDQYLQHILDGREFPAFAQQMRETMAMLEDDGASVQRLTNIVLRDYALTLKIIRAANSVHYNRTGRPIQSATHAMLLLGARTVRTIASGMLLFEHYHQRSPGLKELMLLSMLTANHAREVALRLGLAEPEDAHLCGMFRNLGEVLIACHFPAEYTKILALIENGERAETAAAFEVLGFHYEELGEAMGQLWHIPDAVKQAMRSTAPATASPLSVITAFSHDLTVAIYRQEPRSASAALAAVVKRYAARLDLSLDEVKEIVRAAVAETREIFAHAGVSLDDLRLKRQVAAALGEGATAGTTPIGLPVVADPTQFDLRDRLLHEVEDALGAEEVIDLDRLLLMVLEGILRGGPFDRVLFAVVNAERSEVEGRLGLGERSEELLARFRFPIGAFGGPVGAALARRLDLLAANPREMGRAERNWAMVVGAGSFVVYPIVVARKLVGCLYLDRLDATTPPDQPTIAFVRALRAHAARAIELRRAQLSAPDAALRPPSPERPPTDPWTAARKGELVLRLLRGESPDALSAETGVAVEELERWRAGFLAAMTGV